MKKGFSLIELMVVIALASILLLVTANFLIFSIQRNNQATIENEVRNEANYLLDSMGKDIRNSSCECYTSNSIYLFGSSNCDQNFCKTVGATPSPGSPTPYAKYAINSGRFVLQRNDVDVNSNLVNVQRCDTCLTDLSCVNGLIISSLSSSRVYLIDLNLRQSRDNPRSDYCGRVEVKQTFKPRNN
jgi:prepilin-type N-terminal cleavage/methylation domain-containing protein